MNNTAKIPAVIQAALLDQKVPLDGCNLMLPTQTFGEVLGMFDKVTVEVVTINPDPEAGEVFPLDGKDESDKLALGKIPLEKIGNALGIVWDPKTTTIIESSERKSRAKATGAMRKPNGEYIVMSEEKTVDLGAIEEEQRFKVEKDAERGKIVEEYGKIVWETSKNGKKFPKREPFKSEAEKLAWIDREVRKGVLAYRKFKDERAMTGAKERVIRAFLAIKGTYTRKELEKPFAFPRVTLDAAKMLASPETRAAAVERLTGSVVSIFGPGQDREMVDVSPAKQLTVELQPSSEEPSAVAQEEEEPLFEDEGSTPQPPFAESEEQKVKRLREQLAIALEGVGPKNREAGRAWLANSADSKNPVKLAEKIAATDQIIAKAKARREGAA
jgi:hypothetical protein